MNIDILDKVLNDIQLINKRSGNIILIRSTVTPGTTTKLAKKFTKLNIVFNPEFFNREIC